MILSALQSDCYRRLGFSTSNPDAATVARILAFLNETQQEIFSEPGLEALKFLPLTFASVASTPTYALPQGIARFKIVSEQTNDLALIPQSFEWYRHHYPDPSAITGTPQYVVDLGMAWVSAQPSNASQLLIDSTSASDTNTAYIEGYRTGGLFRSTSVLMTGTTAVNLGNSDFLWVTKLYLSAAAVGTVTLVEDVEGGTVLATIPIGATSARSRLIALAPTPASAITYTVEGDYDVPDLANATDESILPPRFHRLLVIGARLKEYEKQQKWEEYNEIREKEWKPGLNKLKWFVHSTTVGTPNLRGSRMGRSSQLGAMYPAGS